MWQRGGVDRVDQREWSSKEASRIGTYMVMVKVMQVKFKFDYDTLVVIKGAVAYTVSSLQKPA